MDFDSQEMNIIDQDNSTDSDFESQEMKVAELLSVLEPAVKKARQTCPYGGGSDSDDFDEDRILNSGQKVDSDSDVHSEVNSSPETSSSGEGSEAAFEELFGQKSKEKSKQDIEKMKKETLSKINRQIRKLTELYMLVDNTIDIKIIEDTNAKIQIIE